jgi:hypothetical protein
MDSQIEVWRSQQFAANVLHLSQQEGSVIERYCRKETFVGKTEYFDRLGQATAEDKVGRNVDTPNLNIAHTRRALTTITRHWGTLVDKKDQLQNLHSPVNEYAKAAAMGLGRKRDQVQIEAAFGTAYGGESGTDAVILPNIQKVTAVSASAIAVPNAQFIRKAKRTLDAAKVKGQRHIFHAADFLEGMLAATEVSSSDYNTVKALAMGELNSWCGFEFHLCEEIYGYEASDFDGSTYKFNTGTGVYDAAGTALVGTEKVALCVAGSSLICGENTGGRVFRISERNDKSHSDQIYTAQDMGGLRIEDEAILQLIYKFT